MNNIETKDLTSELIKREGITTIKVEPYQEIKITAGTEEFHSTGPAIILVNQD